jgi:GntR family transcriptional repressor for pyruvate dehydrogenase complex
VTAPFNIDPIRREPVATQIARRLVEVILSGQIEPGSRMPSERQLAEAFGVGRSAMREALKALSLIGLVEVRQGDGTYLRKADTALLPEVIEWGLLLGEPRTMDLVEARQEIEIVLAGLAAQRRNDDQIARLQTELTALGNARTPVEFAEHDIAFHVTVADAAGNSALRDVHSSIQALLRAWILRALSGSRNMERSYAEHIPIVNAIVASDAETARCTMREHMQAAAERLAINMPTSSDTTPLPGWPDPESGL